MPKVLVLGGGGFKGIAHIGALNYLQEHKLLNDLDTVAGSSIGSIVGALLVLGYTPHELRNLEENLNLSKLRNTRYDRFTSRYGIDDGNKIVVLLKKLIGFKTQNPQINLQQLFEWTQKHRKGIDLVITVVRLEDASVLYINHQNYPQMPLYLALRMSMSIPFLFTPVVYEGKHYVDGGCIDNYPIDLFRSRINETLGLFLRETKEVKVENIETMIFSVVNCLLNGCCKQADLYRRNTIDIETKLSLLDFNLTLEKKRQIYQVGYECAEHFFRG